MEFFERAHVSNLNNCISVEIKTDSDENMKRRLKQMLLGYKKNDNKIILESAAEKPVHIDNTLFVNSRSELEVSSSEINCPDNTGFDNSRKTINPHGPGKLKGSKKMKNVKKHALDVYSDCDDSSNRLSLKCKESKSLNPVTKLNDLSLKSKKKLKSICPESKLEVKSKKISSITNNKSSTSSNLKGKDSHFHLESATNISYALDDSSDDVSSNNVTFIQESFESCSINDLKERETFDADGCLATKIKSNILRKNSCTIQKIKSKSNSACYDSKSFKKVKKGKNKSNNLTDVKLTDNLNVPSTSKCLKQTTTCDTLQTNAADIIYNTDSDVSSQINISDQASSESDNFDEDSEENSNNFDTDGILAKSIIKKLTKNKIAKSKLKRKSNTISMNEDIFDKKCKTNRVRYSQEGNFEIHEVDEVETDEISHRSASPEAITFQAGDTAVPVTATFSNLYKSYRFPTIKNRSLDISLDSYKLDDLFTSDGNTSIIKVHEESILDHENSNISEEQDEDPKCRDIAIQYDQTEAQLNTTLLKHDISNKNDKQAQLSNLMLQNDFGDEDETKSEIIDNVSYENIYDKDDQEEEPNFENSVKVYYPRNSCILVMKHPCEIYVHGKVKVTLLSGHVKCFGKSLSGVSEIFAPYTNYAQCIETAEYKNSHYGLFNKLTSSGLSVVDTEEIVTTLSDNDAVIQMHRLDNNRLDFVENNFFVTDLFVKTRKNVDLSMKQASDKLNCSLYNTKPMRHFIPNESWVQVLESGLQKASRGIICGAKGMGKSTFVRYYVNQLINKGPVLLIDLDPGQCEFTVAGNISATVVTNPLLGPSYTHLKTPNVMLNIGMINVMDNVKRYKNAVAELINQCSSREQFRYMPWIVNTMGMCNTLGFNLMTFIIIHLKPTFLLQFDAKSSKKRFESFLNAENVKKHVLERKGSMYRDVTDPVDLDYVFFVTNSFNAVGRGYFSLAPRDERYLNFLAYFGELLQARGNTDFLGIAPYEVPINHFKIGGNIKLNEESLYKVINGKIIALCQHTQDNIEKLFTFKDKPLLCHGYGLIRGIDLEKEVLYILTPVNPNQLSLVNCLMYSDWTPELRGWERQLPDGSSVPYRTATLQQQRELMFTPKRRFNPLQLLKMSRLT